MTLRITHLLAAFFAAFTLTAAPALAQDGDPGEIVRAAAAAMQETAERTANRMHEIAANGIETINRLDHNGASDEELIAAARHAMERVNHAARHGNRHVGLIAARAAHALRALHAEREFFRALAMARRAASEAIGDARHRANAAIQEALREALDD